MSIEGSRQNMVRDTGTPYRGKWRRHIHTSAFLFQEGQSCRLSFTARDGDWEASVSFMIDMHAIKQSILIVMLDTGPTA